MKPTPSFFPRSRTLLVWVITAAVVLFAALPGAAATGGGEREADQVVRELSGAVGISISPLLSMGIIGGWSWYATPVAERAQLPFHKQPIFWGPLLLIVAGIVLKDGAKGLGPMPKQFFLPADAVELVVNKGGGVVGLAVVTGGVLGGQTPELTAAVHSAVSALAAPFLPTAAWAAAPGESSGVLPMLWTTLTAAVVGFSYIVVWLVSNICNVLILLSPFRVVDCLLKGLRLSLLALLVTANQLSPWLGGLIALVLVVVCSVVAARAFRFMLFGTLFSWDFLLRRRCSGPLYEGDPVSGFACGASGVPAMTYGTLSTARRDGATLLQFRWRPWLVFPARTISLPIPPSQCEVGIGTLSPVVMRAQSADVNVVSAADLFFRLRPRYHGAEVQVAGSLGIEEVQDVGFGRGVKAVWRWLQGERKAAACSR